MSKTANPASRSQATSVPDSGTFSPIALPENPKRRLKKACAVCRERKTKCDGKKPICGQCHASGRQCSYQDRSEQKSSTRLKRIPQPQQIVAFQNEQPNEAPQSISKPEQIATLQDGQLDEALQRISKLEQIATLRDERLNEVLQRISKLEAQIAALQQQTAVQAYGTSPYVLHSAPLLPSGR